MRAFLVGHHSRYHCQRRATRYILSLPFMSGTSCKDRLLKTSLLPLSYWHEYLDIVYLYKTLVLSNGNNMKVKTTTTHRLTRGNSETGKIILKVPQLNTLTFQRSYFADLPGHSTVYHQIYASRTSQLVNLNAAYFNIIKTLLKRSVKLIFLKRLKQCA